jgi:hypothetical protein
MIKYLPVQNEDGAIEAWVFINDENNSRIILADKDIPELSELLTKILTNSGYGHEV